MLLSFMVLAVPVVLAASRTVGDLERNSNVWDKRLHAMYNAGSGVEAAIFEMLNDPNFDDGLTPTDPSKELIVNVDGEDVTVTVSKIFTGASLDGLGLVVSKAVIPTSTSAYTTTTFSYTITVKNEGTGAHELEELKDRLPAGFTYNSGTTTGDITTAEPELGLKPPGGEVKYFLTHGTSTPYVWYGDKGTDPQTGSYTPAQGVWEAISEYWEKSAYTADGVLSGEWKHKDQGLLTAKSGNRWRWKVQRVRGAQVTDLFTSSDQAAPTSWNEEEITHTPADITILSGDKLRLRLEFWSNESASADRLFQYRWGGDDDDYKASTEIPNLVNASCAGESQELKWKNLAITLAPQKERTLTFQVSASLPEGTHYNYVEAEYRPWWSTGKITTCAPYSAGVTVGSGTPICGFEMGIEITQSVSPQEADAGVQTDFDYTITFKNVSPQALWMCEVKDWIPPTFTYVSGYVTGDIDRDPQEVKWKDKEARYELKWKRDQWPENNGDYIFTMNPGETKSFTFRTRATLEQGVTYHNEVKEVKYSYESTCEADTKTRGGTDPSSSIATPGMYDITAVAADGTVLARVQLSAVDDVAAILSWQEYQ